MVEQGKGMADWINKKKFRVRNKHPHWITGKDGVGVPSLPRFEDEGLGLDIGGIGFSTPTMALRRRFLEFSRVMCPEMVERFDSGPLYCFGNKPEFFEQKFREWLEHYGFYDKWQYDWFEWHIKVCKKKNCGSELGWFFPEEAGSKVEISLPSELKGREARRYVEQALGGILDQIFGRLQVGDTHLKWFIRFQVMGHTAALIAQEEMKHPSVINKGIAEMADRLSLKTLRRRTRRR